MSLDEAIGGLRRRLKAAGLEGIEYEIEVFDYGEGSEMSPDHPFAELVRQSILSVTGTTPATIGMTFTTDARFVRNQARIPAVVCGPGNIAQAHGIDEWVSISQLVDATAAYAGALPVVRGQIGVAAAGAFIRLSALSRRGA